MSGGIATGTVNLPAGTYTITIRAVYSGDDTFRSSSAKIMQSDSEP